MIGLGWVNVYATGRIQTGFRLERRRENLKISLLQYAADVDYKRAGSYEGINRETLCFVLEQCLEFDSSQFSRTLRSNQRQMGLYRQPIDEFISFICFAFCREKEQVGSSCNDDLVSRSLFFLSFILTIKQNVMLFFFRNRPNAE